MIDMPMEIIIKGRTSVSELKLFAKKHFKDIDLLNNGFALDCITVVFHTTTFEITNFDELNNFKMDTANFKWPESGIEMLQKLIFHCGRTKVEKLLNKNIAII